MGLAPYGELQYVVTLLEHLMNLNQDGSLRLDLSCFRSCQGRTTTSPKMDRHFARPPRAPESLFTQGDMDLPSRIQRVTEEILLRTACHACDMPGLPNFFLPGGVALNCVNNSRILSEKVFDCMWLQPEAGDTVGALGVAWLIWHQALGHAGDMAPPGPVHGTRAVLPRGATRAHAQLAGNAGSTVRSAALNRSATT